MMRVVVTRDRAMASAAAAAPLRAMPRCRARCRDAATPPSTSGRDDARPRRAASSVVAPRQTKNAGGATTTRGTTISARGARGGFDPFASSPAIARDDPFADAATPAAADDDAAAAALPRVDWTVEVRVTEGKFAGYTLLCSAFIDDDVPRVADLLLGSGMAGFPLERRTLETYLRGAVPAFPYGTYLVGRLRAPRVGVGGGARARTSSATTTTDSTTDPRPAARRRRGARRNRPRTARSCAPSACPSTPRRDGGSRRCRRRRTRRTSAISSSSRANAVRASSFLTLVPIRPRSRGERRSLRTFAGASIRPRHAFNPRPRRLSTPLLTPFNSTPTGEGLGSAMLRAAETFARDMKSEHMYLHVATKKPGVVRLYRGAGYTIRGVDPGLFGWRGRLLMRKEMGAEDALVARREYKMVRREMR